MRLPRSAALAVIRAMGVRRALFYARFVRYSCLTPRDRTNAIHAISLAVPVHKYQAQHFVDRFMQ